jgi:CHAT domain-containing protein
MKIYFILFAALVLINFILEAQVDPFDQLKCHYDSLRNENKFIEALTAARKMIQAGSIGQIIGLLWSVPDKETMELMTLFYSDLTKTKNPVSSFEKAQKEMRNKYPTEPEIWAGFVLFR